VTLSRITALSQLLHDFMRPSSRCTATVETMTQAPDRSEHVHQPVTLHALGQRAGIPYELERCVCAECRRVLSERTLRRAAA
jgi:hypothetical protein